VSCQNGVEVSGPPSGLRCDTSPQIFGSTKVCVQYDGDFVYVRDGDADGHAALGIIDTPYTGSVRTRFCRNPHANGSWARCNFDWPESGLKTVSGGYRITTYGISGYPLWEFSNN